MELRTARTFRNRAMQYRETKKCFPRTWYIQWVGQIWQSGHCQGLYPWGARRNLLSIKIWKRQGKVEESDFYLWFKNTLGICWVNKWMNKQMNKRISTSWHNQSSPTNPGVFMKHLLIRHILLDPYHVPDTVLGTEDTGVGRHMPS